MSNKTVLEIIKNLLFSTLLTVVLCLALKLGSTSIGSAWIVIGLLIFTFLYMHLTSWSLGNLNLEKLNILEAKINTIGYSVINIEKKLDKKNVKL
jgi:hypothetical protein